MSSTTSDLLSKAIKGDRASLARLLSILENDFSKAIEIESHLINALGNAIVVGVTGPPGAGKSSIISELLHFANRDFERTAVIAVDPTSPFTKGALLGDRVRMNGIAPNKKIFIRSMASRGNLGGLARSTVAAITLFDGCGWPLIIVETLGIGQIELDIAKIADMTVVVLTPGWGDNFQANKAGLTECGDIYVINKCDRPGTAQTKVELEESLNLIPNRKAKPPVLEAVATKREGIDILWKTILNTFDELSPHRKTKNKFKRQQLIRRLLENKLQHVLTESLESSFGKAILQNTEANFEQANHSLNKLLSDISQRLKQSID
ncbi:MAG: methylmalonyl Co-A mutase-associated GTPase MeaB [Chloroflexota bacterium]|nr:methylmalonyl Co-A mutase-associated GTPase MeaB [Chloroflexota bacterium]